MMKNHSSKSFMPQKEWDDFIKTGDTGSLELLYNYYFDLLYNYGKKYRAENYLIEDAIQNVFLGLIRVGKGLKRINNLHSYILCSFRNELFRLISRNRKIHLYDSLPEFAFHQELNPEEEKIQDETELNLKQILFCSIKKLTPSQQEILYMRYNAELSYEDISKIMKISINSCRTAVYRAIKTLKKDIEQKNLKIGSTMIFSLLFLDLT